MKTLDLYIYRNWRVAVAIVLFALLSLFFLFTLASELGDINQHYGIASAIAGTILRMPYFLQILLPMALLVGTCIALTRMACRHELEATISAGARPFRIACILLLHGGLPLAMLALGNNELVVPWAQRMVQQLEQNPNADKQLANIWLHNGKQHISIAKAGANGYLQDISIFSYDSKQQLEKVEHAEYAVHINGNWNLFAITGNSTKEQDQGYSIKQKQWDFAYAPEEFTASNKWDVARPLPEIARHVKYSTDQRYINYLWQRVSYPLLLALMLLLGVILVAPNSKNYIAVGKATILLVAFFMLQKISNWIAFSIADSLWTWLMVVTPMLVLAATTAIMYRISRS